KKEAIKDIRKFFAEYSVSPEEVNSVLKEAGTTFLSQKAKLEKVLSRPQIDIKLLRKAMKGVDEMLKKYDYEFVESAEIEMKYEAYMEKEMEMVQKMEKLEDIRLKEDYDYSKLKSLSIEARQKLSKIK